MWNGTTPNDLGTLGGRASYATSINASGQVVGYSTLDLTEVGNNTNHATLWSNGNVIDLNSLVDPSVAAAGWVLSRAYGINNNGWIVGYAFNPGLGITNEAFLLSVAAVPESDTSAMLLTGLGLIGFIARRRKGVV